MLLNCLSFRKAYLGIVSLYSIPTLLNIFFVVVFLCSCWIQEFCFVCDFHFQCIFLSKLFQQHVLKCLIILDIHHNSGADIQNNRAFLCTSMKFGMIILYIHTNNFRYGATLKSSWYATDSHFQNGRFCMPQCTLVLELPVNMKMLRVL